MSDVSPSLVATSTRPFARRTCRFVACSALLLLFISESCGMPHRQIHIFDNNSHDLEEGLSLIENNRIEEEYGRLGLDSLAWTDNGDTYAILANMGQQALIYRPGDHKPINMIQLSEYALGFSYPLAFIGNKLISAAASSTAAPSVTVSLNQWDIDASFGTQIIPGAPNGSKGALDSSVLIATSPAKQLIAAVRILEPSKPSVPPTNEVALYTLDGNFVAGIPLQGSASCLAFSADGTTLAAGAIGGPVSLIQVGSPNESRVLDDNEISSCTALAFSTDGRFLAVGYESTPRSRTGDLAIIEVSTGITKNRMSISPPELPSDTPRGIASISWDQIGDRLAVGSKHAVKVFSHPTGSSQLIFSKLMARNADGHVAYRPFNVRFSSRGVLAISTGDTVLLYR